MQLNTLHQSNWNMSFSNIPTLPKLLDMSYYDNFVKSITLPNYDMLEFTSNFQKDIIRHPVTKSNEGLAQFQVTFRTTEDFLNYYYLMEWAMQIKYAQPNSSYTDPIRKYTINLITVNLLDNEKRIRAKMEFTKCFLASLSSLGLEMGLEEEAPFTASFTYEEVRINAFDVV